MSRLSNVLKSKNEENEAYLSEIEVIFIVNAYGPFFSESIALDKNH